MAALGVVSSLASELYPATRSWRRHWAVVGPGPVDGHAGTSPRPRRQHRARALSRLERRGPV